MVLHTRAAAPFHKNGYLLDCGGSRDAVLLDPGDEVRELLEIARAEGLAIRQILLTHAHMDHVSGVAEARRATGAPVVVHEADLFLYESAVEQGAFFGYRLEAPPPPDAVYASGQIFTPGTCTIRVLHTPGHSPGGVCLAVTDREHEDEPLQVFSGDTLFANSIGRTDLPGGDYDTLITSIRTVLFALDAAAVVYPGHGPSTTIGAERRSNPFLRP
jgi:hydroxyacylglutathione hydrolase